MSDPQEIEATAIRLLTTREHSRKELLGKLTNRGFDCEQVETVLDALALQGLQSDTRFTEQYIEGRVRKGSGPVRIRAELRERGVDDNQIDTCLEPYAELWMERLRRVHEQKYGASAIGDRKELARQARFLEYRGFPTDLIAKFLFHSDS